MLGSVNVIYSFFEYVNGTQYCIYDTVNTTTVVVSFWTFVYDMLIYYKTWIYQCLIMQVKSPSIYILAPRTRFRSANRVVGTRPRASSTIH